MGLESQKAFEPSKELPAILSSAARETALAGGKAAYINQRRELAGVQADIIKHIRAEPDTPKEALVTVFDEAAERGRFSDEQRKIGAAAIEIFEERRNIIKTVRQRYPDERELFKAVFGVMPLGSVRVEDAPIHMNFICSNRIDLARVANFNKEGLAAFRGIVTDLLIYNVQGGAVFGTPRLPELKDMVVIGKGSMQNRRLGNLKIHEEQHMFRHILLAASERMREEHVVSRAEQEPWKKLLRECKDSVENDLEDELLAMSKGRAQNVSRELSESQYFQAFVVAQADALHKQLSALEAKSERDKESDSSKNDLQKVIEVLEGDQFKEELWKKTMQAYSAYQRLRNIGEFSHEEVTAFFDLEPLGQWPKLEKRIQGNW